MAFTLRAMVAIGVATVGAGATVMSTMSPPSFIMSERDSEPSRRRSNSKEHRRSSVTLESMWNPPAPVSPDPPPWTFTSPKSSLPLLIPARTSSAEVTSTSAARAADDGASPSEFVSAASTPRPPSAVSFGLEVWQKQISELEGELSQLREESQHLQVMNAELNEEVHARTEDITALEVRRTQAVYACTDVEGRIQHAQGSLATLQAEILAHTASRGRAQADLQHAQLQLSRTNCALDDVQSRLDARQSQLSAADLSLAEVMRDIDTKKAELHKLTETGKLKDTRLSDLAQKTSRLEVEADNAQNRLSQILRSIQQAETDLALRKKDLSDQEVQTHIRVKELQHSVLAAQRQHNDEAGRIEAKKVELSEVIEAGKLETTRLSELSQNTSRLKRDADNAQNRLSQVLREIKQADMDLASRKQVLSHQENRARIRLSELHQSISTAQRQHKDEIIRLEGAKTEFDREKKMEAKHRATTRETAAALDALTNRKQQAEQEAQAAEDDATRLRDTIRRAETELGDLRAAIKDASATLDQMRTSKPEDMNMNVPEVSLVNFLSPTTSYEDALKIKAERRMEPGQETREHYIESRDHNVAPAKSWGSSITSVLRSVAQLHTPSVLAVPPQPQPIPLSDSTHKLRNTGSHFLVDAHQELFVPTPKSLDIKKKRSSGQRPFVETDIGAKLDASPSPMVQEPTPPMTSVEASPSMVLPATMTSSMTTTSTSNVAGESVPARPLPTMPTLTQPTDAKRVPDTTPKTSGEMREDATIVLSAVITATDLVDGSHVASDGNVSCAIPHVDVSATSLACTENPLIAGEQAAPKSLGVDPSSHVFVPEATSEHPSPINTGESTSAATLFNEGAAETLMSPSAPLDRDDSSVEKGQLMVAPVELDLSTTATLGGVEPQAALSASEVTLEEQVEVPAAKLLVPAPEALIQHAPADPGGRNDSLVNPLLVDQDEALPDTTSSDPPTLKMYHDDAVLEYKPDAKLWPMTMFEVIVPLAYANPPNLGIA